MKLSVIIIISSFFTLFLIAKKILKEFNKENYENKQIENNSKKDCCKYCGQEL